MDAKIWIRLSLPLAAALLLIGLCLASPGKIVQALQQSENSQIPLAEQPAPPDDLPQPDEHWLDLLHRLEPGAAAVGEQSSLTINIHLLNRQVAGHVPLPAIAAVTLERAGKVLAQRQVLPVPDPGAYFYSLFIDGYLCDEYTCEYVSPQPGDVLRLEQSGATISMTIPVLTAWASAELDQVSGQSTPGLPVNVYLTPFADPTSYYTASGVVLPDGSYVIALAPLDLRRRDSGYSQVITGPGCSAYQPFTSPFLGAEVGNSHLYGKASPGQNVSIDILSPDDPPQMVAYAYGYSDTTGDFSARAITGTLKEPYDEPGEVALQAGMCIRAEAGGQVFSMTVPHLTAYADHLAGQISGEAAPGAVVEARRFTGPMYLSSNYSDLWRLAPVARVSSTVGSTGVFTTLLDLLQPDFGAVFLDLPDENQAYARFTSPHLLISMGALESRYSYYSSYLLIGQSQAYGSPFTFTVRGPSGYLKDQNTSRTSLGGILFGPSSYPSLSNLVVEGGDVVTVAVQGQAPIVVPVPPFTAAADGENNRITGLAPAYTRVTVYARSYVYPPPPPSQVSQVEATQVVTASVSGVYTADFTGIVTFTPEAISNAWINVAGGHTLQRQAGMAYYCPPRLADVMIGGNQVGLAVGNTCGTSRLRLRSSQGLVRAEQEIPEIYPPRYIEVYLSKGYEPVSIEPGDVLELENQGQISSFAVPSLTVQIDASAASVSGLAPAGSALKLIIVTPDGKPGEPYTGTAALDGTYLFSLSDPGLLPAGARARVEMSGSPPNFYRIDVVPRLETTLYVNYLEGFLPPNLPYTVTLTGGAGVLLGTGRSGNDGSFYLAFIEPAITNLHPGDQLAVETGRQIVSMTLPVISAEIDLQAARISGQAPPDSRLTVYLGSWNNFSYDFDTRLPKQEITASSSGVYSATFASLAPLGRAMGAVFHTDTHGNITRLPVASPYFDLRLGTNCLSGGVPTPNQVFTLTHQDTSGYSQVITQTTIAANGYLFTCLNRNLQSGDRLTLEAPGFIPLSYTIPGLYARHDYARQVLEGLAPGGAKLEVLFPTRYQLALRRTTAAANGLFGIDTSDLIMSLGSVGEVSWADPAGAIVRRPFLIEGYRVYLPVIGRAGP